ncbi:MAG: transcriptional repressor [Gemmatimonadota bacterium]|nr:transcriptional repressor [Gemmatimonadota bacterium]
MPGHGEGLNLLHRRLRANGQRLTPQRLLILELLYARGDHATADEIFAAARERYPYLNISTVYRTLELLRDIGILSETDLGDDRRHFALLSEDRHHHLICLHCGCVQEIDDRLFDGLRAGLQKSHDFTARIDHLALFGSCQACASSAADTPADEASID